MTRLQPVVVRATYVETVAVRFVPTVDAPPELDWRRIGQGAVLGALFGTLASATQGDLDSTVSFVAGVVNVAASFAIIGALWGAVFFSPEDDELGTFRRPAGSPRTVAGRRRSRATAPSR